MAAASRNPLDRIVDSTFDISRIMRQRMLCEPKDGGVNFLQLHALMIISEQPGITMKELASSLRVTSPSATSFVGRLVKLQWVERLPDAQNRKLVRLGVTAKGKSMLQSKIQQRQAVLRELFSLLTRAEQRQLATLHEKFLRQYRRAHS